MRAALAARGLMDVDIAHSAEEAVSCADDRIYALVIGDFAQRGDPFLGFVSDLRHRHFGLNPFAAVIAKTNTDERGSLKAALASGVDRIVDPRDLTLEVEKGLDFLISERRAFVVTSDYVGPDRRSLSRSADEGVRLLEPPAMFPRPGEDGSACDEVLIERAWKWVAREKISLLSERMFLMGRSVGAADEPLGPMLPRIERTAGLLAHFSRWGESAETKEISGHIQDLAAQARILQDRALIADITDLAKELRTAYGEAQLAGALANMPGANVRQLGKRSAIL